MQVNRDMMVKLINKVKSLEVITGYEDHTFNEISFSEGAIGTRGYQQTWTPEHIPVFVEIVGISDSTKMLPIVFLNGTPGVDLKVYLNVYRATTDSTTGQHCKVRSYY